MNSHDRPLPTSTAQISIDTIMQYRCALGNIPHPTKELSLAIAAFDNIILNFANGLTPNQGLTS